VNVDEFRSSAPQYSEGGTNLGDAERVLSLAAGIGLGLIGLSVGRLKGLAMGALGAGLIWRGYSGRCQCYAALGIDTAEHNRATAVPAQLGRKVEKSIVVNRAPSDLYHFWRRLENLPRVMQHLKDVYAVDGLRSHWVAEGVLGQDVEWDAELINERENEMISWRSLPGGDVDTAGSVHFKPLDQNRATEVTVSMKYNPPAGKVGARIAGLMGAGLERKLDDDLCRFKQLMEAGRPAAMA
jgi:uncharacterized membrane protein